MRSFHHTSSGLGAASGSPSSERLTGTCSRPWPSTEAWFAARPSGTEDVYKIYAESFKGPEHLAIVQEQAKQVVSEALG